MLDLDARLSTLPGDLERPVLHVPLDFRLVELAANETFGVEYGIFWVGVECILRCIADETFVVSEGYPRRCYTMSLFVRDNFYPSTSLCTEDTPAKSAKRRIHVVDSPNTRITVSNDR